MIAKNVLPHASTAMACSLVATSAFRVVPRQPQPVMIRVKNQTAHALVKAMRKRITGPAADGAVTNQKHLVTAVLKEVMVVASRVVLAT